MRRVANCVKAILSISLLAACAAEAPVPGDDTAADPTLGFWTELSGLCGSAFEGQVVEAPAGDTTFAGKRLVMHVRTCTDNEIRVPFHVGDDRSRTWVVSRTEQGLRLKHDHRHEDGSEDSVTQYGGDSRADGSSARLEFLADSFTAALIPPAATNVWTLELVPSQQFAYALRREGTDRRFRIEFDLTTTVAPPPPPWGDEG